MLTVKPARLFAMFLVGVLVAFASLVARPVAAEPARWTYADEDTTVLMVGTIHVLKPGTDWLDSGLRDDLGRANGLILETVQTPAAQAEAQSFVLQNGLMQGESLKSRLGADYVRTLKAFKTIGVPEMQIANMRPWLATVSLVFGKYVSLGYNPALGVDTTLEQLASEKGIPVEGLEATTDGLKIFAGLSKAAENRLLLETVDGLDEAESVVTQLTDAWLAGDVEASAALINESVETSPELMEALVIGRNKAWLPKLKALLDRPGLYVVAVGSGHLAGNQDLVELLTAEGIAVTRVQ